MSTQAISNIVSKIEEQIAHQKATIAINEMRINECLNGTPGFFQMRGIGFETLPQLKRGLWGSGGFPVMFPPRVAVEVHEQESTRKKSESIPCQTAKGKEKSSPLTPVALEKSKNKVNEELQSSSSPVANGSGKDTSNPLIADNFLKTDKVSLRPSYAQIIQNPEETEKTNSRFYVIFDGEHRGIYEDWSIVSKYVTGKPFPFIKFGSLLQAQQEATRYSTEFGKKEIPLKVIISPEPFIKKKEKIIEFKKNFSKTTVKSKEEIEEEKDFISLDEFRIVWSKASALSQDEFETEHLYTEDKATKSLIICCPGSSLEMNDLLTRIEDKILLNKVDIGLTAQKSLCSSLSRIVEDHNCEICGPHSNNTSTDKESFFSKDDTRELDPTHGFID
ncbi:hypothetical protein R6Q59_030732 [Mikania micrantha]